MSGKLYLIDASSYAYRAFYAIPPLANARGVPTHATLGFVLPAASYINGAVLLVDGGFSIKN